MKASARCCTWPAGACLCLNATLKGTGSPRPDDGLQIKGKVMALSRPVRMILTCTAVLAGFPAFGQSAARVDARRLLNADKEAGQWMSHSRTYDEQYFSPLDRIN